MKVIKAIGLGVVSAIAAIVVVGGNSWRATAASSGGSYPGTAVDAHGNLHVPADYRDTYQPLGSWAVAADEGRGSKELHVVLASPGSVEAYRKNGRFPEGTVLVKEVFNTATKEMTTGTVSHADDLKGWFVMVKDSAGSSPGHALCADGWGWS